MKEIIEYKDSFGVIDYPQGFENLIDGLSIAEQLKFFRMGCGVYLSQPLHERIKNPYDYSATLDESTDVKAIIVHNGKIAGVMVLNTYGKIVPCMVENGYCIKDEEELDGSGYKSFTLYSYLICVTEKFDG